MAETPHFFKVILPQTLIDKKLRIPEKFIRKFGGELSAVATLMVPNGRVWQVELTEDGRKFWFHKGWHDFVEYHSISVGYLLVFKYLSNSNFHILIFDKTACEIQYPYYSEGSKGDKQKSIQSNELETEDSVMIVDFTSPNPPPSSLKRSFSKMHSASLQQNEAEPPFGSGSGSVMPTNSNQQGAATLDSSRLRHASEKHSNTCKPEKLVEIDESNQCKLNSNEIYQRGPLQTRGVGNLYGSSAISQTKELNFDRTKFKTNEHVAEEVGNTSDLQKSGHQGGTHSTIVVNERSKFDEKQLLASLENSRISINERYKRFTAKERERAITVARLIKPKNPSFMIVLRSSDFISGRMYVPAKFAKEYLGRDRIWINVQLSNGSEWPILIKRCQGSCCIQRGWHTLARELNVQAGDICVFELIRVENILLKASVFYASSLP